MILLLQHYSNKSSRKEGIDDAQDDQDDHPAPVAEELPDADSHEK
jgi:hypothetical protein